MRRYNQAWLLDPDNYPVYWGLGRITDKRGETDKAILHFQKSKELIDDDYQKPALLNNIVIVYHNKALKLKEEQEQKKYFN